MRNYLYHYGVKGMKWGVRKVRDTDAVNDIHRTLSIDDKRKLNGGTAPKDFTNKEDHSHTLASFLLKHKDVPISAFDIWSEDDGSGKYKGEAAVSVLTRSGEEYRNKGYASKVVKRGMDWVDKNPDIHTVYWDVRKDNVGSIKLAKKHGFRKMYGENPTNPDWTTYRKKYKR